MKKIIILLTIILGISNNAYSTNNHYQIIYHKNISAVEDYDYKTETLDINDFTNSNLQKYSVDENTGVIYRIENNITYYPTYEGRKCYDLKTEIDKITETYSTIPNIHDGGNIIVKSTSSINNCTSTYVIDNKDDCYNLQYNKEIVSSLNKDAEKFLSVRIPSNVNIIIPHGITLVQNDVTFHVSGLNVNLIVLGTIVNYLKYEYINALFYFPARYCNVIIGPKAKIGFDNIGHDSIFWLEKLSSSIIMYPGCNITTKSIKGASGKKNTVSLTSKLYLNRYTSELSYLTKQISGIIAEQMEVIYPIDIVNNVKNNNKNIFTKETLNSNNYIKTNYFPNLYWRETSHNLGNDNSDYNFEEVETLSYNLDENRQKLILGLNPNNKFAKYDIAFWNQCAFNGPNGFNKYNKLAYKGAYIDLSNINNLFYNMKKNEQIILANNKIYPGLLGGSHIQIDSNNKKLYFYGDNREFTGILMVPDNIKEIIYDNDYCTIKNILQLGKDGKIKSQLSKPDLSNIKIIYKNANNWNVYFNDGILKMNVLENNYKTQTLILKDSSNYKKNVIIVTEPGDIKKFDTVEVLFDNMKALKFCNTPHLFVKNMHNIKLDFDAHGSDINEDVDNNN